MLRMMWVLFLVAFLAPMQAAGAVIERLEGHPEGCTLMVSGLIQSGDAEVLREAIPFGDKVCFESEGGNWAEGVNIALALYETRVPTHIPENSVCLSACAIAFLGGTQLAEEGSTMRSRSMHSSSTLGFHAISLNVDGEYKYNSSEVERAFRLALDAVSLIYSNIEKLRVEAAFVNSFLQVHGADQFIYIDTVGEAERLGVTVTGVSNEVGELDRDALRRICFDSFNYFSYRDDDRYFVSDTHYFTVREDGLSGYYDGIFVASNEEGEEALSLCFYRPSAFGYDLYKLSLGTLGVADGQSFAAQRLLDQIDQGVDVSYLISELLRAVPSYFRSGVQTRHIGSSAQYHPSVPLDEIVGGGTIEMWDWRNFTFANSISDM